MDRINGLDHFTELPVSLVLFALICADVIERIRPCKLLGPRKSAGVVSVVEYMFCVSRLIQISSQCEVTSACLMCVLLYFCLKRDFP